MNLEQEKRFRIKGRRKYPEAKGHQGAGGWLGAGALAGFALQGWRRAVHLATVGPLQPAECAELRLSKDVPAEQRRYRNKM